MSNPSVYLIQPSYRDKNGVLLKGRRLSLHSAALPALSAAVPPGWTKRVGFEYFEEIDVEAEATVVGISSMGYDLPRGRELAAEFRRRGRAVVFGGWQSHYSAASLRGLCDSVVHGNPGPRQLAAILEDARRGSLQPEYHCEVEIDYPFDYSVLDGRHVRYPPIVTGVGCLNACAFCCVGAAYRARYHARGVEPIMADVRAIAGRSRRAAFVDSNLYADRTHALRVCDALIAEGRPLTWGAQATIDIGDDEAMLSALRAAGCTILFVGVETLVQSSLDRVGKPYHADQSRRRIRQMRDAGLAVAGYFLLGLDGETVESVDRLGRFIEESGVNLPIVNIVLPVPGTPLGERLRREGRLLFNEDVELLQNNGVYNSSCNRCFFVPKRMTARQLEEGYLALCRRLVGLGPILRRSWHADHETALELLGMNLDFRHKTKRMVAHARAHSTA
jgi:radical SAM superfamily enzyme YgiQ (UPF0313 family)